ncbi:FkbM family methyltransferase [Brevundimonas staleyi]|uniref:FkbM family methyltransferase n=1 Tax=Brevundimonas staleyi TaxID=74326 RepID=A0ABW0FS38_9CAUL
MTATTPPTSTATPEIIQGHEGRYAFSNPEDYIARHLRHYGQWEINLCLELLKVLPRREAVIRGADAGANIGLFSIQMMSLATKHRMPMQIDAFEVQPAIYADLVRNIELNDFQDVIRPLHQGVGRTSGVIEVEAADPRALDNAGAFSLRADVREHFALTVPTVEKVQIPIAPLASGYDFIKIDVEGMELDIIQGAEDILRAERPAVIVEAWGPEKAPWFQAEADVLLSLLRDIYPRELPMGENTLFWS